MDETANELLVRRHFADERGRYGRSGLLLPDGWFGGRPFEGLHALTLVCERPKRLLIELDDHILLSIVGPYAVTEIEDHQWVGETESSALRIEGYSGVVVEYVSYDRTETPGVRTYNSGAILLV